MVMMAIDDESVGGSADISGVDCWRCCMVEVAVMLDGTGGGPYAYCERERERERECVCFFWYRDMTVLANRRELGG